MDGAQPIDETASWRVVVVTNIPGGVVYHLVDDVVRPLGHRIVGVVTSPGPRRRRSASYLEVVAAVPPGVDVLVSNHPSRWAAMVAPLRPDLIVCGGMPWRLPMDMIALPRLGTINMHPALLPCHRGPASVEWALRNGDPELGLTVHRMDADFDTGAILAQGSVPIDDEDDIETLLAKFGPVLAGVLGQALERVARGDPGEPQDETQASEAGLFEESWRTIDWDQPARTVHNQVRSWTGMRDVAKGALGEVEGEIVQITKTRLLPDEVTGPHTPGTVLRRDGERLVVQCRNGALELVAWNTVAGVGR
jgi:methionyl-tRNA formyltransferase